jgi:hypothetical protein
VRGEEWEVGSENWEVGSEELEVRSWEWGVLVDTFKFYKNTPLYKVSRPRSYNNSQQKLKYVVKVVTAYRIGHEV